MAQSFVEKKRIRKNFGRIGDAAPMPNLIQVQKDSYEQFLQRYVNPSDRAVDGLEAVFRSVFPISDTVRGGRRRMDRRPRVRGGCRAGVGAVDGGQGAG